MPGIVINVHQDFFGVPWTDFAANTAPPPAWAAKMAEIAEQARATGKDVVLALAPLDGDRARLAPNVVVSATGFDVVHGWKPPCYDLATAADGTHPAGAAASGGRSQAPTPRRAGDRAGGAGRARS